MVAAGVCSAPRSPISPALIMETIVRAIWRDWHYGLARRSVGRARQRRPCERTGFDESPGARSETPLFRPGHCAWMLPCSLGTSPMAATSHEILHLLRPRPEAACRATQRSCARQWLNRSFGSDLPCRRLQEATRPSDRPTRSGEESRKRLQTSLHHFDGANRPPPISCRTNHSSRRSAQPSGVDRACTIRLRRDRSGADEDGPKVWRRRS